jgi:SecD/SecF fusion protein
VSDRRKYLFITGLLAIALVVVGLLAIPGSPIHRKPTLGLDLQGGLEVVLEAAPPENRQNYQITSADIDRSVTIMRDRIDKLGVSEPEIRKQGAHQIVIQLAGVHDPEQAAALIGKTAQLQFYDLQADIADPSKTAQGQPNPKTSLFALLASVQSQANGKSTHWYLFDKKKKLVAGPATTRAKLLRAKKVVPILKKHQGQVPKGWKVFGVPSNRIVITCGTGTVVCPGTGAPTQTYYYLFEYEPNNKSQPVPEMTGNDLNLGGTRSDFDQNNQPVVLMSFTGHGKDVFQKITAEEARRGKVQWIAAGSPSNAQPYFQSFAIVLDNEIKSFPTISFQDYPNGIGGGGGAQITGLNGIGEAKNLALVLQTGALPVRFITKAHTEVSATLGKDSLAQAKTAALIGLLVVALFLLLFYRFLGLVAVIGLAVYAAFMYAAILLFHVTLTLPGFAGMILTIGVAADANVVIFERIKEEVRSGKSVRHAIATGYAKGFHTIIDANVVTAITALVLFAVATAQVKGFALMLLIGTVISLVTAVAATRALLGLLAGFRWFDNPRFMGAHAAQRAKWLEIDFMGKRFWWLGISGLAVLISVVSLGVKGLNLGIDFKGGTQITFTTPRPVSLGDVRTQAGTVGKKGAVVQGKGALFGSDSYKDFQVRTRSLTNRQQTKFTNELRTKFDATVRGATGVSSSFGRQIARAAILAVVVSLLLIVLYISIRFQFKFALPVIIALVHDIALTVGVYSLTGREVTTATVAAVLTVLGYSIYDTIIIFDRIRENIPLMRRAAFATIANVSLWETIRRSLATSFITLLPVGALLLFGGATLKDFAFALLIGIASGAYSSIFIAAPLLTMWKEREPEYARRRESAAVGKTVGMVGVGAEEAPAEAEAEAELPPVVEPEPELVPAVPSADRAKADERRQRRQQRRRTRPHGRAR